MPSIRANEFTYLKKAPIQSDELGADDLCDVSAGKSYSVEEYNVADGGHYLVKLAYDTGEWYIWSGHWKLSWEEGGGNGEREDNKQSTEKHQTQLEPEETPNIDQIDWNNPDSRVSQYFRVYEVTQGDKRRVPQDPNVIENIVEHARNLDKVREQWKEYLESQGKGQYSHAISVTSWYRPPEVNREVGGVPNSQHINGSASDTQPVNGLLWEYQRWLDKHIWSNKALGYGAPRGFVHLDERKNSIRWHY